MPKKHEKRKEPASADAGTQKHEKSKEHASPFTLLGSRLFPVDSQLQQEFAELQGSFLNLINVADEVFKGD